MKYEKFAQIINENGKFSECAIDCLLTEDAIDNLVRNVVSYASSNNNCKTNWIAFELLTDVISEEKIAEIFNEE